MRIIFIIHLIILASCSAKGQAPAKKAATEKDYALWSRMSTGPISADGNWISYGVHHAAADTVFVKHTRSGVTWHVPNAGSGVFSGAHFLAQDKSGSLKTVSLQDGRQTSVSGVTRFESIADGKHAVALAAEGNCQKLVIIGPNGRTVKEVAGASAYAYNKRTNRIACTVRSETNSIIILDLNTLLPAKVLSQSTADFFLEPVWQENGASLAFLREDTKTGTLSVGHWKGEDGRIVTFRFERSDAGLPMEVAMPGSFFPLQVSDDGKRVFFGCKPPAANLSDSKDISEVWNAADRRLYPDKIRERGKTGVKMGVWWPASGRFLQATDKEHPKGFLSGDQRFAVVYDPEAYAPCFTQHPDVDLFAVDLETGSKKKILEKMSLTEGNFTVPPAGNLMAYFKSGHWWLYDFINGSHRCLTQGTAASFLDSEHDWPGQELPYGNPGWAGDGGAIYLYDRYDVWEFSTAGAAVSRLTRGRETRTRFRIVGASGPLLQDINWDWLEAAALMEDGKLLLSSDDGLQQGYWKFSRKKGTVPLVVKASGIANLRSSDSGIFACSEQRYELPERLLVKIPKRKEKVAFQSNRHHGQFNWGRAEMLDYAGGRGQALQGVLYYPAGYDPGKKYPMVVRIYEKQSGNLYRYHIPGYQSGTGYNLSNLVLAGYFVLLPDIAYVLGDPGISATDCVAAGVEKALSIAPIDRSKIGLMGQSFGGYQTNFIVTQTPIFSAAVSGSANSDLMTSYLYNSRLNHNGSFWRLENGQVRMEKTFFEDREAYIRNSPLHHLSTIRTPLLSWAGKADAQVNYFETPLLHMGMRRLGKEHIMLAYPDEEHVMTGMEAKRDLGKKIEEWFGFWLKGDPKPQWMEKDFISR